MITEPAMSLYGYLFEKIGQAFALSIMKTLSWHGRRVWTDEEAKEINRRYVAERRARKRR